MQVKQCWSAEQQTVDVVIGLAAGMFETVEPQAASITEISVPDTDTESRASFAEPLQLLVLASTWELVEWISGRDTPEPAVA